MRLRSVAATFATSAAAAANASSKSESVASTESDASVIGVIVLFRHGARAPVFSLPDSVLGEQGYDTLTTAPPHAYPVEVCGGKNYAAPPQTSGLLTRIGWAQGEALGRSLRGLYGPPGDARHIIVQSTDVSRTVLTAQALLTGLVQTDRSTTLTPARITVESDSPMPIDTRCARLAKSMAAGRAAHRANDDGYRAIWRSLSVAFSSHISLMSHGSVPPVIAVHDDCIARRFAGKPPSQAVDVMLCDWASREAAREARALLKWGGELSARMAAGRLCGTIADYLRNMHATTRDTSSSGNLPTQYVLLSGHDTSLMMLLNQLDPEGRIVPHNEWPPHTAYITVEMRADATVQIVYGGAQILAHAPYEDVIKFLDRARISPTERRELCGAIDSNTAFSWSG